MATKEQTKIEVELQFKKSTTHKHVFSSKDEEAVIDTVYVAKDAFPGGEAPSGATLTFVA